MCSEFLYAIIAKLAEHEFFLIFRLGNSANAVHCGLSVATMSMCIVIDFNFPLLECSTTCFYTQNRVF